MDVKGIYFQICTILFNKANNKYLQDVIHLQNPFIPSVAKNHWLGTCAYGRCVLLRHFAAPVAPWLLVSQTWKQIAKLKCMDESLEMMRLSHSEASLKWRFRGLPGQFEAQKLEVLPSGWSQAAFDLKVMALYIRRESWVFALLIWDSKTIHCEARCSLGHFDHGSAWSGFGGHLLHPSAPYLEYDLSNQEVVSLVGFEW